MKGSQILCSWESRREMGVGLQSIPKFSLGIAAHCWCGSEEGISALIVYSVWVLSGQQAP